MSAKTFSEDVNNDVKNLIKSVKAGHVYATPDSAINADLLAFAEGRLTPQKETMNAAKTTTTTEPTAVRLSTFNR